MRPLKVCFINFTRKWGGVKSWTLDFGGALQERGVRAVVVCRPDAAFAPACRARGLAVHAFHPGPKANPLAIARVWRILGRERPDVTVVNISRDLDVGAVASRLRRIPVVHRVGLVEDFQGTAAERLRHRLLVSRILVPGASMKRGLLEKLSWLRAGEVEVIPNSKDGRRYAPATGSGAEEVTFGTTSQLSKSKGHRSLFQALAAVLQTGQGVRLRVAGTGPLEAELRSLAKELDVGHAVEFCGFQRDVPSFLSRLDAFVLPSLKEGFPNTLLEALFSGLPVIASDLEGTREMVGEAGLLVPPGEAGPLAESLALLARGGEARTSLGRAARQRALDHFELGKNAGRLESFLRTVAGA